ncbi:hypothetical protein [Polaromonas glacialis]|uniref:hypothetical protein n=1 Tax=Polaromonas glacialis TaxID=866564 RepID=UPI0012EC5EFD|nr:hypothetical protein [Polaromonas glacialis]
MARWEKYISTVRPEPGVINVTILVPAYPTVAEHWRQQLTGANLKKWGRIFIDPAPGAAGERRSLALAPFGSLYKGQAGANLDECPGAMFIWDSQEPAHVHPTDARSNQDFGRDLYFALLHRVLSETGPCKRMELKNRMAWWEVRFAFQ